MDAGATAANHSTALAGSLMGQTRWNYRQGFTVAARALSGRADIAQNGFGSPGAS